MLVHVETFLSGFVEKMRKRRRRSAGISVSGLIWKVEDERDAPTRVALFRIFEDAGKALGVHDDVLHQFRTRTHDDVFHPAPDLIRRREKADLFFVRENFLSAEFGDGANDLVGVRVNFLDGVHRVTEARRIARWTAALANMTAIVCFMDREALSRDAVDDGGGAGGSMPTRNVLPHDGHETLSLAPGASLPFVPQ
jgi:hypothetical protein